MKRIRNPQKFRCPACYAEPREPCRDLRANGPSSGPEALKRSHKARQALDDQEFDTRLLPRRKESL